MRVTIRGSGSPITDGRRGQAGYLVTVDGFSLLFDCGGGVAHRVANTAVDIDGLDPMLLRHHHLAHVSVVLPLLTAHWLDGGDP